MEMKVNLILLGYLWQHTPKLHPEVLNRAYCLHISCSGVDCLMGDQMNEVRVQKSFENAVILLTLHLIFTQKKNSDVC